MVLSTWRSKPRPQNLLGALHEPSVGCKSRAAGRAKMPDTHAGHINVIDYVSSSRQRVLFSLKKSGLCSQPSKLERYLILADIIVF